MSPVAQALYFGTIMHASGIIAGWHYRKWFKRKRMPGPLDGEPKVIVPPKDCPESLRNAFWAGHTSDYLNPTTTRQYWTNACKEWVKEP